MSKPSATRRLIADIHRFKNSDMTPLALIDYKLDLIKLARRGGEAAELVRYSIAVLGRAEDIINRLDGKPPPGPGEPIFPVPVIDEDGIVRIDERSLIRESRAYEATTGPPRRPGAENDQAPPVGDWQGPFSRFAVRNNSLDETANLPRTAENLKPEFFRSENCARNSDAASAERTPDNGGFADENHSKTRH
jgi:hypothetical protein